ncbi:MAG TPA: glutathione S-transferase [Polyangiaceae bacterium]|jgi:glutathione S-transferase
MPASKPRYELYYWPSIQGRGELVRLIFEAAGEPYVDVARLRSSGAGVPALMKVLRESRAKLPFAPPILKVGDLTLSQTGTICRFLAERFGLVPKDEKLRLRADALNLTILDLLTEAHDVHHPLSVALYYEDQKAEARRASSEFTRHRIPKFLDYFERVLKQNAAAKKKYLIGEKLSYVDLSMFQLLSGLTYAFPNAMRRINRAIPELCSLRDRVAKQPNILRYLNSPRRIPFNQEGIFRYYPELDEGGQEK